MVTVREKEANRINKEAGIVAIHVGHLICALLWRLYIFSCILFSISTSRNYLNFIAKKLKLGKITEI